MSTNGKSADARARLARHPRARFRVPALALTLASLGVTALWAPATRASGFSDPQLKHPFRVVIDPGHGGSDHGTIYRGALGTVAEKNVTLALAKQAALQLRAQGYSVILTRESDRDLSLPARTALANRLQADLFLSIHMNSNPHGGGGASGIETYILNNATDATSKRLAQLENSVLEPEDTTSPEQAEVALILKDLRLDANLSQSKRLACALQSRLAPLSPAGAPGAVALASASFARASRNRGVKQALFYVLLGADMPSVLVEAGFLNSAHDRAFATSPAGQRKLALGIAGAIDQFRQAQSGGARASLTLSKCKVN